MKSGLEIAQEADLQPIADIARTAGLSPDELELYGRYRAKVELSVLDRLKDEPDGHLVITTAITPTKAGEGKTTTSVSLTQGLGKIGKRVALCLREPSMGPVFGIKGGGNGGGYAQVVPMEEINLHLNGDFHAVTAAHNLLAAALDASIFNGNALDIDPQTVTWPRTLDVNDRELRYTVVGLGGKAHGVPRENQFVITAASEIMAVFALASDLQDLRARLGRIVVADDRAGKPVTAEDLKVAGAMTVIMKDAIKPNLVQTLEGQPVLIHAGPFGNIAHANNSIIEDRVALKLADYVVTEAGFASDLGFQKFCDIVCRVGRIDTERRRPGDDGARHEVTRRHAVLRAGERGPRGTPARRRQPRRARRHREAVRHPVRGVDQQLPDRHGRRGAVDRGAGDRRGSRDGGGEPGVRPGRRRRDRPRERGGEGLRATERLPVPHTRRDAAPRADRGDRHPALRGGGRRLPAAGGEGPGADGRARVRHPPRLHGEDPPVAVARPDACSTARSGFRLPVRSLVPSAGAGFVVALCGDMQRMPGLGKTPAFMGVDIDEQGRTVGLF